jgi:hypothetical protein
VHSKKGYYRQYKDLRVGCLDIDSRKNTAIIRLTDTKDTIVISVQILKVGEDYQVFNFKGREISIRAIKIDDA